MKLLSQDRRYITTFRQKKRYSWLFLKGSIFAGMKNVCMILTKFCPEKTVQEIQDFIYVFFPFMFGIYPYTAVTDKQREAMKQANVDYIYQSVFEITNNCLLKLL